MSWLPIDQVPKDGTIVLVAWKRFPSGMLAKVRTAFFDVANRRDKEGGWWDANEGYGLTDPDFFMPIPKVPE